MKISVLTMGEPSGNNVLFLFFCLLVLFISVEVNNYVFRETYVFLYPTKDSKRVEHKMLSHNT